MMMRIIGILIIRIWNLNLKFSIKKNMPKNFRINKGAMHGIMGSTKGKHN